MNSAKRHEIHAAVDVAAVVGVGVGANAGVAADTVTALAG
jgi:hypothetical protein